MSREIKVVQADDPDRAVAVEVLADSIVAIAAGVKKLRAGRLNERALLLLIWAAAPTVGYSKVSQKQVKAVLDGIEALERTFIKKAATA